MAAFRTLRAANTARQQEWDKDDRITLTYRLNELAGETGEACNVGKKLERERLGIRGSRASVRDLADELADVVICADLVAMGEGIDLQQAVINKFNATSRKVGLSTMLANEANPTRSDSQVAHRFRFAADILEGMSEGIDGDRLGALIRWALHGQPGQDEGEALIRIFEAPHQAAEDEAGWVGDTRAEAIADIARITAEAEAIDVADAAAGRVVTQIAGVAAGLGWQAGEPAMEIAGGIVSYLANHPEQLERFMREGGEMMIDGTIKAEEGALTWRAVTGEMMNAAEYAKRREAAQTTSAPKS